MFKCLRKILVLGLVFSLSIPSFAAVSVSDGSAFVSKAEFSASLNNLSSRMSNLENSLDAKIDSLVSSYLSRNGIWNGEAQILEHSYLDFSNIPLLTNSTNDQSKSSSFANYKAIANISKSGLACLEFGANLVPNGQSGSYNDCTLYINSNKTAMYFDKYVRYRFSGSITVGNNNGEVLQFFIFNQSSTPLKQSDFSDSMLIINDSNTVGFTNVTLFQFASFFTTSNGNVESYHYPFSKTEYFFVRKGMPLYVYSYISSYIPNGKLTSFGANTNIVPGCFYVRKCSVY